MNPMLKTKFNQIQSQLSDLKDIMEANRADTIQQHAEKADLLQEKWRQRKHLTTLNRISEDYDDVEAENIRYREERQELRNTIQAIISYSKALNGLKRG